MNSIYCNLCKSKKYFLFHEDNRRKYYRCDNCKLVFVPSQYHLSEYEEKKRYDLHQNSFEDEGYRTFLYRIFRPVNERIKPGSSGLDFGSGPGPLLGRMFEEAGHNAEIYDIFYADNKSLLEKKYDFITASEVVEHLKDPFPELSKLWECLKDGGFLGIMTKMVLNRDAFSKWHYITDMTHISFFSIPTFKWLGNHLGSKPEFEGKDVVIFKKKQLWK